MRKDIAIVWFRADLRLHDNEAIWEACHAADRVVPVYIFDERVFGGKTKFGFEKTGVHRAQFIIESVENLRKSFRKKGTDLLVRVGKPEQILWELANQLNASWIYCNRERTQEEVDVQNALEHNLWQTGKELRYTRGKMLYYTADLPFPINHTPDTFTTFRKEVEKFIQVREPLSSEGLPFYGIPQGLESGDIPKIDDFNLTYPEGGEKLYPGGETEGLARLRYFLWESDNIAEYKKTRNGLLGKDFSSKLSPYLAQGCISPKIIYSEIKKYEEERVANDSTYWLVFELLWRDFFRLMGKKHQNAIFKIDGPQKRTDLKWKKDEKLFEAWTEGKTGIPFIDANMNEIKRTGFMSNRGRQNVASFLINDLGLNWLLGAEYFESLLIDYDPCSNYGNWNYLAGVGSDPRSYRYFNIISQAKRYDPSAEYVKHWLPELDSLDEQTAHAPFTISAERSKKYNFELGVNYPKPVVPVKQWS